MTNGSFARIAAVVLIVCGASTALADDREFSFSIGYAHLSFDNEVLDDLDHEGGLRFEPRFTWPVFHHDPRLRIGVGVGLSFFYDEHETGEEFGGFADIEDFEEISLIVPEFQATWRQMLGANWFVEGGVGVGAVFGSFRAGEVVFDELFDQDVSEWDLGFGVRPLVRGFFMNERWAAGLEGSYLFTDLDFGGGLRGNVEELYVGLFYTFRF
jgi:hypothetical protein